MRHIALFLAIISSFNISGCSDGGGLGMKESPIWHKTASAEHKAAYFREVCIGYGFQVGTSELTQCIANESRQSKNAARDKTQRIAGNLQRDLGNSSARRQSSVQSTPVFSSPKKRIDCGTYGSLFICD